MNRIAGGLVLGLLLSCWAGGTELTAELEAIRSSRHLNGSAFGLVVYETGPRRFLCRHDDIRPLQPASNQKLLVTAAALLELGPGFTFTTELYASGIVRDGVLEGDLILRGGGDPNLSGRFHDGDVYHAVDTWVQAVQAAGITQMNGRLLIDDSLFDAVFFHPSWPAEQAHRWYAAEIGALALNDGCVDMTIKAASVGALAAVTFEPYTAYIGVRNGCKTVSGTHSNNIIISRTDTDICLGGTIGAQSQGFSASVAIHDPGLFAGAVFGRRLYQAGIKPAAVLRIDTAPDYGKLQVIAEYHTQDLAATIRVTNSRSQNYYAEMLLKYLGARRNGQGTFRNGTAAVRDILRGRGLLSDAAVIDDGCGLSHNNRVSAADLVTVMEGMYRSGFREAYVTSLAVPGDAEGTLRKRLKGERLKARIYGKSGYIDNVKALSGYVFRESGEVLIFAFLVNNYASKSAWEINNLQDKLMRCLANSPISPLQ